MRFAFGLLVGAAAVTAVAVWRQPVPGTVQGVADRLLAKFKRTFAIGPCNCGPSTPVAQLAAAAAEQLPFRDAPVVLR